ncbi:MAG: iron ABC transporter permease [Caldilineaceae bacterium SB0661_bin_34]|nr:iron ABC transporter permease [Caldilineaceae bacterium SB0661_bin_34]
MNGRLRVLVWALPPFIFLGAFYFLPLVRILVTALGPDRLVGGGQAVLPDWRSLATVLGFTTWQALVSTAASLVAGLPLAWWLRDHGSRLRSVARLLLTVPFVMPVVVTASAFVALAGPSGLLNRWLMGWFDLSAPPIQLMHTFGIIILAHMFYNTSVVVRVVSGFWSQQDRRLADAAGTLGATAWRTLVTVEAPLVLPAVVSSALLVFLFCFSSFGVVLILGGLRFSTLEVAIYRQAVSYFNLPAAAVLALIQLAVTFTAMSLYTRLQRRHAVPQQVEATEQFADDEPRTRGHWIGDGLGTAAALILVSPLVALTGQSFSVGTSEWSLVNYAGLLQGRADSAFLASPVEAVGNSVRNALATMVISLVLGIGMAYTLFLMPGRAGRWLDPVFLLPLGTSAVTLGLGYIISMGPLRTSPLLVPAAHALIASPFVLRVILPALRRLQPGLRQASAVLGATPRQTWWRVELPLLLPACAVAAVFAFAVSMGEFGASLLIARPEHPTMPLMIFGLLSRPGLANLGQAQAMSVVLMAVTSASIFALDRLPVAIREF